jgi:hypothetical protein
MVDFWNGSGVCNRTDGTYTGTNVWEQNRDAGLEIRVANHDTHDERMKESVEACLTKNGENSPTAHLTWFKGQYWGGTSGGSANAQTITMNPALGAYATGQEIKFIAGFTNTGATTLNVNGLGTKTVVDVEGNAMTGGEIRVNGLYNVVYDGTNYLLINPSLTPHDGAWSPDVGQVGGSIANDTMNHAKFTRQGDMVYISVKFTTDFTTPTYLTISTLPFTTTISQACVLPAMYDDPGGAGGYHDVVAWVDAAADNVRLYHADGGSWGTETGKQFWVSGWYPVNDD